MGLALEFDAHNLQTIKLGVHIAQAVLIFITWALEIAVFHDAASIDGRPGWYFGLVRQNHSLTQLPKTQTQQLHQE
jgi:hypothetical protein